MLDCISRVVKPRRFAYIASWFLAVVIGLFAFDSASAQEYQFDNWTTNNGLPQNSVRGALQTSDGYIWFTTLDGLVRFDGVRFTVFNKANSKGLPSNRLVNLFAEADDTLWISTEENGVVRYRNGEFRSFTKDDGLPSDHVPVLRIHLDGNIYVYTPDGAARFDGVRFTRFQTAAEIRQSEFLYAPSGTFWEINQNSLVSVKGGQKSVFELPADLKKEFSPDYNFFYLIHLFEDGDGVLWISANTPDGYSLGGRLFKFANGKFEEILAEGMPPSVVLEIAQDRRGNLWLATIASGACRLSESKFTCFSAENQIASKFIPKIFTDREGTLWISTDSAGIYRLREQFITSFSRNEGLAETNVYPILEEREGAFWIGSLGGLARYKDGRITNYSKSDGLVNSDVQALCKDRNGRLWIGSYNGLQYFENGKFHFPAEGFSQNVKVPQFFDIHQDRDGNLWFATLSGLLRYDGSSTKLYTTGDGLPGNSIKVILENDDGSLWIGTQSGLSLMKDEKFTNYTDKDGLAGNYIRAIYKDETGTLWIGTYDSGLSRFKDGRFTTYTVESGLSSNGVFQILEDEAENFWISSNQGIYRVSREQLNEFAEGRRLDVGSILFGKSDGMLTTEANGGGQPAGIKASDGRLWFPTQNGVAIINPASQEVNPLPPPVVIENALIDNQKLNDLAKGIELAPGQTSLEIHYTGLTFIRPEQVKFRYRLEGLDENWREAGSRREAFYQHLPPGEYVFHVIAANSDNVWNEQGAKIPITVNPPLYRRWWFILMMVLIFSGIIIAFVRRRISKLTKERIAQQTFSRQLIASQEQERKRIAAELHDSLGQRLVVIKNLALMFLNAKNGNTVSNESIENISAEASHAIGEVKEISYNLRPYQLDRIGLTKAIQAIVRSSQTASTVEFSSEIEDIDDYFPKDAEINFYRIVQECVNNLIKHSEATAASVKIKLAGTYLDLEISDNGKGFVPGQTESKTGGFGLTGIVERAEIFGGNVEIKSAPQQGTTVKIRLNSRNFPYDNRDKP